MYSLTALFSQNVVVVETIHVLFFFSIQVTVLFLLKTLHLAVSFHIYIASLCCKSLHYFMPPVPLQSTELQTGTLNTKIQGWSASAINNYSR